MSSVLNILTHLMIFVRFFRDIFFFFKQMSFSSNTLKQVVSIFRYTALVL